MKVENVHSSGHSPVPQIATHILCILSIIRKLEMCFNGRVNIADTVDYM